MVQAPGISSTLPKEVVDAEVKGGGGVQAHRGDALFE